MPPSCGRLRPAHPSPALAAVLVLVLGLVAACGVGPPEAGRTGPTADDLSGEVVVLAAASLTETFTALGRSFTAEHPGSTVTFSFGSSSTLATQIVSGAPADVFAAANESTMDTVVQAGRAVGPTAFATNVLKIAVPTGNPAGITGLADFADPDRTVVVCAAAVPCGAAAAAVFAAAGVTPRPDSYEADVKAALTKVRLGEADAALVYATDVAAARGEVDGVTFPEARQAVNTYPIAAVEDAPHGALARAFVAYVLSPRGREVLSDAGFGTP